MMLDGTSGKITVSVILTTYSVYLIKGSQPLFVEGRCPASQVELASLVTDSSQ